MSTSINTQKRITSSEGEAQAVCLHMHAFNVHQYMHTQMAADLAEFQAAAQVKTGYANMDLQASIYPGLYVIGGMSSLGKTTFVHQMCDQMAKAGEFVIYFSVEQNTLELVSKSLARIIAQHDLSAAMSSLQVRKYDHDPRVQAAIAEYDQYASNIIIVKCGFYTTIDNIQSYVDQVIRDTGRKPIVAIDYLQAIQAKDPRMGAKDVVDSNIRALKEYQSTNKLIMIVISSLNRQNYMSAIDYESYKESGGIEYTADVLWGLQFEIIHNAIFDSLGRMNEKRQLIKEAKAAIPRKVELVCLKNRFGISSYTCNFDYYSNADLFIPQMDKMDFEAVIAESDPGVLTELPAWYPDQDFPF